MKSRYQKTLEQWERFQKGLDVDVSIIRPEILASWKRCKLAGVPVDDFHKERIKSQREQLSEVDKLLKKVAVPLMEKFIKSLNKSKCIISIYDAHGRFIHKIGDPVYLSEVSHQKPGTIHTELAGGTSVVSLVLGSRNPAEIYGPEHWIKTVHHRFGSGAPLVLDGQFLGLLCCSLDIADYSPLTLAMVEMAAHMLIRQFRLDSSLAERDVLLKLIDEGLLYVDCQGRINYGNDQARSLLKLKSLENASLPASLLARLAPDGHFRKLNMQEMRFPINSNEVSCTISCFPFEQKGAILSLRRTREMKAYVARQAGYTARYTFDSIIGASADLAHAIDLAKSAARSDITTLIYGGSGTGKELFAHAIHNASDRRSEPFIAVNCGAIPRSLVESELFGYADGAFTGAARMGHPGKFELADGGTIFLDEVGELSPEAQTALLRVIQSREIERIGGTRVRAVNVRIIAATNKDLAREVLGAGFRKDLFYRINALTIVIPSLARRRQDIPLLVNKFLEKNVKGGIRFQFSAAAMRRLCDYSWPGNVRQLENVIDCAVAITSSPEISLELLNFILAKGGDPEGMERSDFRENSGAGCESLSSMERAAFEKMLCATGGNVKRTSERLGISRKAAYNRIKRYQIDMANIRTISKRS